MERHTLDKIIVANDRVSTAIEFYRLANMIDYADKMEEGDTIAIYNDYRFTPIIHPSDILDVDFSLFTCYVIKENGKLVIRGEED